MRFFSHNSKKEHKNPEEIAVSEPNNEASSVSGALSSAEDDDNKSVGLTNVSKSFFSILLLQIRLFLTECLPLALPVYLIIEALSRKSVIAPFTFCLKYPAVFLYNLLLVCMTYSVSFLFRKRLFVRCLVSILWLAVGITDFVTLSFRVTPFTAVDLLLIKDAFSIMKHYLNVFQIVLIVAGILLVVSGSVVLLIRSRKSTKGVNFFVGCDFVFLFFLLVLLMCKIFVFSGILERNFGNLNQAYLRNGLPYCFTQSLLGTGISKPSKYSEEEIERILASISATPAPSVPPIATPVPTQGVTPSPVPSPSPALSPVPTLTPAPDEPTPTTAPPTPTVEISPAATQPNVIFLQLESFFDPEEIVGAQYSETIVPTFRELKKGWPTGYLSVPCVGAGTANTEFEILTGMDIDFFGPGEYPYKTILKKTAVESLATDLSAVGLIPHAIHNNDGDFYDRHIVFSQMGFSTFTPIEYMSGFELTPLGWPKDKMLTAEIMKVLRSTKEQDFIYTISVQGHGAYPTEPSVSDPQFSILSLPSELESSQNGLEYFFHQEREMDSFLEDLLTTLSSFEEEVVLVVYGDHLPAFPFENETMKSGSMFQTEYVIWDNKHPLSVGKRDLQAYELSSYVLNMLDVHDGLFTRFHQTQYQSDSYLKDLEMLEYDILYGNVESYNGESPYRASDLQFGTDIISISSASVRSKVNNSFVLIVRGENFTPSSVVKIDGETYKTLFISPTVLSVSGVKCNNDNAKISVAQIGVDDWLFSETPAISFDFTNVIEEPD